MVWVGAGGRRERAGERARPPLGVRGLLCYRPPYTLLVLVKGLFSEGCVQPADVTGGRE